MKKYVILIIWNDNLREMRICSYITYLLLKLRFLFSKVEITNLERR